ncbi:MULTISPECIES: CsbD family protein [unclassified Sphingomonas]|uniref:CsbD family protein n=1 Tax=unclassified Sphingomonas TaxID=196159 RepID=UPI00226A5B25|nr:MULTISPECIES: CsbD family protein [unclassified Sphingomonas]
MNTTTLKGDAQDITGKVKEGAGKATGNELLQGEGLADQLTGAFNKTVGVAKDALGGGVGPAADKAKNFAKARPYATAALASVIGLAVLNTLRGK